MVTVMATMAPSTARSERCFLGMCLIWLDAKHVSLNDRRQDVVCGNGQDREQIFVSQPAFEVIVERADCFFLP